MPLGRLPEQGDLPPTFRALNAGKKSVTADLGTAEGRALVLRLAESADVFVENFRPGVARRLGLGPEAVRAVRPGIVYCSISGWGQAGANAPRGAYDHVIQAATGMMALQGSGADAAPVKVGFPVVDIATGISAAEAILAALIRRLRGDEGPITLDVSMVDSALALMAGPAAVTQATGRAPDRVGNRGFVGSPGAETFATADGHLSVAANTMGQFATLCRLLGRPVRLVSSQAEAFTGEADTLVMISILQSVRDVPATLQAAFNAIKPGGWLVFSDRVFDGRWDAYRNDGVTFWDVGHPCSPKAYLIDHFLAQFEEVHLRRHAKPKANARRGEPPDEQVYFIGRRKA